MFSCFVSDNFFFFFKFKFILQSFLLYKIFCIDLMMSTHISLYRFLANIYLWDKNKFLFLFPTNPTKVLRILNLLNFLHELSQLLYLECLDVNLMLVSQKYRTRSDYMVSLALYWSQKLINFRSSRLWVQLRLKIQNVLSPE
jgi:hypothetical protein